MVSFRVTQQIHAPPPFVVDWWLDYSSDDVELTPGLSRRKVERIDENRIHLSTTAEFGGRLRTTDGTVSRTGPRSWHMTGHVVSNGFVVSTLQTSYSVEPRPEGSCVIADFEFVGRAFGWRLALAFSGYALKSRQRRAFRDYARAIERDFAARGASPSSPPPRDGLPAAPVGAR